MYILVFKKSEIKIKKFQMNQIFINKIEHTYQIYSNLLINRKKAFMIVNHFSLVF